MVTGLAVRVRQRSGSSACARSGAPLSTWRTGIIIESQTRPPSSIGALHSLAPLDRIRAIADANSVVPFDPDVSQPRASPHLARWGIAAQDDDGVVVARAVLLGRRILIAAQDERFLGGSAGAGHAAALQALFERSRSERPDAVVLLMASGGVRLHEANAAELALARALSALLDARAVGIRVLALGVGDVFGGASVLACAAERLALIPGTRLGLSGPGVIESTHGTSELDASDVGAVNTLFGAEARAGAGHVELLADDAETVRAWIALSLRTDGSFAAAVAAMQARLAARLAAVATRVSAAIPGAGARNDGTRDHAARLDATCASAVSPLFEDAESVDTEGWVWKRRGHPVWIVRACASATFGPREAHAMDDSLLALFDSECNEERTVIVIEDSAGHEATRAAEALCVSQYLAQHAAVLALLRARRVRIVGLLAGIGHSAAFFANALQASSLWALRDARVVAMDPAAIARVTRLDASRLAAFVTDDALLGQPVRCFAQWGGIEEIVNALDGQTVSELVAAKAAAKRRVNF